jgi:hypothetical protein
VIVKSITGAARVPWPGEGGVEVPPRIVMLQNASEELYKTVPPPGVVTGPVARPPPASDTTIVGVWIARAELATATAPKATAKILSFFIFVFLAAVFLSYLIGF